ncbi:MAG: DPP IV N-terminal domain-containing protein [Verrucomicrobia subdivision 3 bacterium]|nr:DPP IV N-terminal domain-containing protein [Limisphaerales bacterium]
MQVFSSDSQGGQVRQLTNSEGNNVFPAWSFDGKRIAFASNRTGQFEIWVMDADGNNQKQLTFAPADPQTQAQWSNGVPAWSPDGTRLAFGSARSGKFEIWVMPAPGPQAQVNADGREPQPLTTTPGPDSQGSNAPS